MRHGPAASLTVVFSFLYLAGCATSYGKARTALALGRYEEAATEFEQMLARNPDRLNALIGLGVARYKLGAYDEAIHALTRAVGRAPRSETAQLYLGLSHLQKGDDGPAEEHLKAFVALQPNTRIAAQVERALKLMHSEHLSLAMRTFIASTLDDAAEWVHEVREEQFGRRAYAPMGFYGWPYGWGPCFVTPTGRLVCW
jgi:tetratricopeptide (TPR) repeat protein